MTEFTDVLRRLQSAARASCEDELQAQHSDRLFYCIGYCVELLTLIAAGVQHEHPLDIGRKVNIQVRHNLAQED